MDSILLYISTGVFSKRSNGFKNSIEAIVRITVVIMDRIIENCTDFWKLSCSFPPKYLAIIMQKPFDIPLINPITRL